MKYLSSYYWQQGDKMPNTTALLLQQMTYGHNPLLFACVCTARKGEKDMIPETGLGMESAYLTGQLLDWFQRIGIGLCGRGTEKNIKNVQDGLCRTLDRIDGELLSYKKKKGGMEENARMEENSRIEENARSGLSGNNVFGIDLAGILCVGNRFLLFYRGKERIYLINMRFLRSHVKCLTRENKKEAVHLESGVMQPGIGILIAAAPFYERLTEKQLEECLAARELRTQLQLDKHLSELGAAAQNGGAVLLVTR